MFEWHFTIRGPTETPYENGIYHGKIELPTNYPMAPPDIYFFTVCWTTFSHLPELISYAPSPVDNSLLIPRKMDALRPTRKSAWLLLPSTRMSGWLLLGTVRISKVELRYHILVVNILKALISMFPIPSPGAIGSIETPDDKVRELAEKSHRFICPKCKASKNSLPPRPFPVCSNLFVSLPCRK